MKLNESYLFVDVLNYIEKTLNERTVNNDLASMVRIFGNAINENGTYVLLSVEKVYTASTVWKSTELL